MRALVPIGVGVALALSACAKTAPEGTAALPDAPKSLDSSKTDARADVWSVPTLTGKDFTRGRRASTFAGVVRVPEYAFTNEDLHRNFMSIALRAEAADDVDGAGEISIAKWTTPIRYRLYSANPADYVQVAGVISRLRLLTGLDIDRAAPDRKPNVELMFVSTAQRATIVDELANSKAIGPQVARLILRWRDTEIEKCLGLMATEPNTSSILNSVILIKDELPRQIRDACIVEEIVQSLGLMNDDRRARPSIFNDDQQYLDLTSHDEYLLRILYDPRVRPGMTRRQVGPLARGIIGELRPGSGS